MSLEDLPTVQDALKLEKSKFYEIVKRFIPHSHYCRSYILPEKMTDWCNYLECNGDICTSEIVAKIMNKDTTAKPQLSCKTNNTQDPILNFNGSCYDDYFCIPEWASKDYHYILGLFSLLIFLLSIILTLIYIKGFLKEFSQKNTASFILVVQACCDLVYLLLTTLGIFTIFTIYTELSDQIRFYSTFHIYIILYLIPLAHSAEALSIWIFVIFSFDRFNNLYHGSYSKNILTKRLFLIASISLLIALLIFSILKILMFQIVGLPKLPQHYQLVFTEIAKGNNFMNLVNFWLKMPLEGLLPLASIFIFVSMVFHQLIFSGRLNPKKVVNYEIFQEFRLTKSVLLICCLILISKVPKMALHIMKHEIGIDQRSYVKFDLICHFLDSLFYGIKTCLIYPYMCPIYSSWLQNKICLDSNIKEDAVFRDRLNSIDGKDMSNGCGVNSFRISNNDDNNKNNCELKAFLIDKKDKETVV